MGGWGCRPEEAWRRGLADATGAWLALATPCRWAKRPDGTCQRAAPHRQWAQQPDGA